MACLNKMPEREVWIQRKYKAGLTPAMFAGCSLALAWIALPLSRGESEGERLISHRGKASRVFKLW